MEKTFSSVATECDASRGSQNKFITLGQAGQIAPGRPSASCIWRWCRKGVKSRSGARIKLKHIRGGGKLFTTPEWIHEFTSELAQADVDHFDKRENGGRESAAINDARLKHIDQELEEAGL